MRPVLLGTILSLFLAWSASAQSQNDEAPQWSFIQQADRGSFDGTKLTLEGISPKSIAYTDRPARSVRSVPTENFVGPLWSANADSFAEDPPNAVLAYTADGKVSDAVIEISEPVLSGKTLTFTARKLEGTVPSTFSEPVLMIDPHVTPF